MPFVTDGSVHHTGVHNEHGTAVIFNNEVPAIIQAAFPGKRLTFEHLGGTKNVPDLTVLADGERVSAVSVKHHGSSGTFDYINTSKVSDFLPESEHVNSLITSIRRDHFREAAYVSSARTLLNAAINDVWKSMTPDSIRRLLQRIDARNPEWIAVCAPGGITVARHTSLHELHVHPFDAESVYELRGTPRATTSRQIWRVKNGISTNTNLRVRLALNNGVTALLGLSSSNASSLLTIKIQQDNVNGLLRGLAAVLA